MNEDLMYSIGELSSILKISEHTLRKYEKDFDLKIPRNKLGHRCYTEKELDLFKKILEWKSKGLNKATIQAFLVPSVEAVEQKEQVLELLTLDKLTGLEFKELMTQQIADLMLSREEELLVQYEEKLEQIKEELKDEIKKEFTIQQEQTNTDNQKLLDYIAATREKTKKKSIWDKFRKKQTP